MYRHARQVLEQISATLKTRYPAEVVSVRAFGSRVRGDHSGTSDFDVLVLVRNKSVVLEEGIIDCFVEQEMSSGVSFDPVIKTMESFEQERRYNTLFYRNVMAEGVPV